MTVLSLAAELVLLTRDAAGGSRLGSAQLTPGVGGALLLELALAERIEVSGRKVVARAPARSATPPPTRRSPGSRRRRPGPPRRG